MRVYAKYIYPLGGAAPIRNGYVDYDPADGTILGFGGCESIPEDATVLDGAVTPGFVNAHCHVELSYMKSLFKRGTGMAGFIDQINALRDTAPLQEKLSDIQEQMDSMWRSGVSAMADISNCEDSFAIKAASPMYTRTFLEVFGTEPEDCAGVMASARELCSKAAACGLDAAPTPHACYTMSPELLKASSEDAIRAGFLSYHSEETPEEEEMISSGSGRLWNNRKAAGMSTPPVTGGSSLDYFLDTIGPVKDANVLLVHEVCMSAEGAARAQEMIPNVFVALCPRSNIYIHNALPPVEMLRRSGIRLALGTDSLSSNDSLDMASEMLCLQENFEGLSLGEILSWSCEGGADFLGKGDILGSIAPGKRPGLVLIDHLDESGRLTTASSSYRIV